MKRRKLNTLLQLSVIFLMLSVSALAGQTSNSKLLAAIRPVTVTHPDTICGRPVITSIVRNPFNGKIQVYYTLTSPCGVCTIYVYDFSNTLVTSVTNICGSTSTLFKRLDSCGHYKFLIKCESDTCGLRVSDTAIYNGCDSIDIRKRALLDASASDKLNPAKLSNLLLTPPDYPIEFDKLILPILCLAAPTSKFYHPFSLNYTKSRVPAKGRRVSESS